MHTIQKKKRRTHLMPYFTRKLLIEASRLGLKWDYNYRACLAPLLPVGGESRIILDS